MTQIVEILFVEGENGEMSTNYMCPDAQRKIKG